MRNRYRRCANCGAAADLWRYCDDCWRMCGKLLLAQVITVVGGALGGWLAATLMQHLR